MISGTLSVANEIKTQIENYKPTMELLKNIRKPGMKQRPWNKLPIVKLVFYNLYLIYRNL